MRRPSALPFTAPAVLSYSGRENLCVSGPVPPCSPPAALGPTDFEGSYGCERNTHAREHGRS